MLVAEADKIQKETLEETYVRSTSLEHRKQFAQFFTPPPLAELMIQWVLGNTNAKLILDPAFGLGIFARVLFEVNSNIKVRGYEIDKAILEYAKKNAEINAEVVLENYIFSDWSAKYDGIICNPPYFKFHDYDNKDILKEFKKNINVKLSGFTNLYSLFLLKSIHQLKENGRCAYIVPSEFLNSDYGKLVKSYMLASNTLRHIVVIDFKESVFDDALTTACLILCAKDNKNKKVKFTEVNSLDDLTEVQDIISEYPSYVSTKKTYDTIQLKPEIKWRNYYQLNNCEQFKHLVPFSNFGKVVRGIATGSNDYFIFTKSKAEKHKIEEKYLLPCICKSNDVKSPFFTKSDFETLKRSNRPAFLLDAVNAEDSNVGKYLEKGEAEKVDKRFLTASRNPWYALENRPPAPIWVSVFNRTGLRFVRNEANVSNLTTFHCIYPIQANLFSETNIDLLFAYLLTDTARMIFEDNRREYGNGLQKFEPNDIGKGKILDLALLDKSTENKILGLYYQYRLNIMSGDSTSNHLDHINQIFLERYGLH